MPADDHSIVVIGAGPAGLTAAYEMAKLNFFPLVLEKMDKVGGLARTETYKGFRFDIGGHRFFTGIKAVQQAWEEMLREDFHSVSRLSRIHHEGQLFNYPLHLFNVIKNLGLIESALIFTSYLKAKASPFRDELTFEHWIVNRFGSRLYKKFFKSYTEKVWGIPCERIQADWAAQRIRGLSFLSALKDILFPTDRIPSLTHGFRYPVLGAGMMWDSFGRSIEKLGGLVQVDSEVIRLRQEGSLIRGIIVRQDGKEFEIRGEHFISTMPLTELIARLDPLPPEKVIVSARQLKYRALILVGLVVNRSHLFDEQWIYVHDSGVKVGRIQNYKNWSPAMTPDPTKTNLGLEYFCNEGDEIWEMDDRELIVLASEELTRLGMTRMADVEDGVVFRQPKAYPVYDQDYRKHLRMLQSFLKTIRNLQTIGRNGLHRYNNQDHSMLTAMLAVKNILGEYHDLWGMNTERADHESPLLKD